MSIKYHPHTTYICKKDQNSYLNYPRSRVFRPLSCGLTNRHPDVLVTWDKYGVDGNRYQAFLYCTLSPAQAFGIRFLTRYISFLNISLNLSFQIKQKINLITSSPLTWITVTYHIVSYWHTQIQFWFVKSVSLKNKLSYLNA